MMERKKIQSKLRVLTNDPSLTAWGWAVLDENNKVLDRGCIKTVPQAKTMRIRKGDDRIRRISELTQTLLQIIKTYDVNYLLSELPHGSQNAAAAVMIGATTAIMQTLSDCLSIPIEWYSEADSKKAILKKKDATKKDMIASITEIYQVNWFNVGYKDEAVADAIAVHHCALISNSFIKNIK